MNIFDQDNYIKRYNKRLKKFGYDPRSLGWGGGKERQYLRFEKTLDFSKFTSNSITSILDVGCGFGDLGHWLSINFPNIKYTGIDINSNLIKLGKEKFKLDLSQNSVLNYKSNSFDLVVSNGIFNAKLNSVDQLQHLDTYLKCLFSISRFGIVSDFMSKYVDFQHPDSYHTIEQDVIDIFKKFTKRYIIRNDYLDYEFMLYLFK